MCEIMTSIVLAVEIHTKLKNYKLAEYQTLFTDSLSKLKKVMSIGLEELLNSGHSKI